MRYIGFLLFSIILAFPAFSQVGRTPQNPAIIQILNQDDYKFKGDKKTLSESTRKIVKKLGNDLSFNYFAQFSGPSLSPDYQGGAGYNRFKSGTDFKGDENDPTGSYQIFQAITIGYQLNNNIKLFYAFTFQDDINGNIDFQRTEFDGSTTTQNREVSVSGNDKRIGATFFNVINNDYVNLSLTTFYELSSTEGSRDNQKHFGLGLSPLLGFKSKVQGLSYGLILEVLRNFHETNQIEPSFPGAFPVRRQALLVNLTPYLNYKLGEISTFKSSLNIDWDQQGNQVNSLREFNNNLDDTIRVGVDYNIAFGINAGYFLEAAFNKPDIRRTTLGLTFRFNIY